MILNSLNFIALFGAFLILLMIIQSIYKSKYRGKRLILFLILVFGYICISLTDLRFFLCIIIITLFNYLCALKIEKSSRGWLAIGIIVNILFLAYFKYVKFFLDTIKADYVTIKIILPVGISFYTFSVISYLVDVFKRRVNAERSILNLALYISFFPKLTAGPIERAVHFLPQIDNYKGINLGNISVGTQIYAFGLFKKIVLADHLGVFVDDVFFSPNAFNNRTIFLAVISYSLQIYFDFSGYSDMAIGISKMLGFEIVPNFNLPYISQNISEFWKRWHISLSSWFQDYIYFPLGGSCKGRIRTYFNLFFVMILSGIWHGAGWTFLIWGALHGFASVIHKAIGKQLAKLGVVVNALLTYTVVTLFWIVFRAENFDNFLEVVKCMITSHSGIDQPYTWSFFAILCLVVATVFALIHSKVNRDSDQKGNLIISGCYPILDLNKFWYKVVFIVFCGLTIILGYFGNTAFIYGTF